MVCQGSTNQVGRSSDHRPTEALLAYDARKAKVAELHLGKVGVRGEEDVLWLEIAVNHLKALGWPRLELPSTQTYIARVEILERNEDLKQSVVCGEIG